MALSAFFALAICFISSLKAAQPLPQRKVFRRDAIYYAYPLVCNFRRTLAAAGPRCLRIAPMIWRWPRARACAIFSAYLSTCQDYSIYLPARLRCAGCSYRHPRAMGMAFGLRIRLGRTRRRSACLSSIPLFPYPLGIRAMRVVDGLRLDLTGRALRKPVGYRFSLRDFDGIVLILSECTLRVHSILTSTSCAAWPAPPPSLDA